MHGAFPVEKWELVLIRNCDDLVTFPAIAVNNFCASCQITVCEVSTCQNDFPFVDLIGKQVPRLSNPTNTLLQDVAHIDSLDFVASQAESMPLLHLLNFWRIPKG